MSSFLSLPLPAGEGDGAGASVAIPAGSFLQKTFLVAGSFESIVALEVSEDDTNWGRIAQVQAPGSAPLEVLSSAAFARVVLIGRRSGTPIPYLGVDGTGTNSTATLPVTGGGPGAAVSVASFSVTKSLVVAGTPLGNPRASLMIEASFDGASWLPLVDVLAQRTNGEPIEVVGSYQFMRTNSTGGTDGMSVTVMSSSQAASGAGIPLPLKFSGKYSAAASVVESLCDAGFAFEAVSGLLPVSYPLPAGIASRLRINITSNARSGITTLEIFKNNVATGLLVTVPATTTGLFTATGSVTFAANDRLDLKVSAPGAGEVRISGTIDYALS